MNSADVFSGKIAMLGACIALMFAGASCSDSGEREGAPAAWHLAAQRTPPVVIADAAGESFVVFTSFEDLSVPHGEVEAELLGPTASSADVTPDLRVHRDREGRVWRSASGDERLRAWVSAVLPRAETTFRYAWDEARSENDAAHRIRTMPCMRACTIHFRWAPRDRLAWNDERDIFRTRLWETHPELWSYATMNYDPDVGHAALPEIETFDSDTLEGVARVPVLLLRDEGRTGRAALETLSLPFAVEKAPMDWSREPPDDNARSPHTPPVVDHSRRLDASE